MSTSDIVDTILQQPAQSYREFRQMLNMSNEGNSPALSLRITSEQSAAQDAWAATNIMPGVPHEIEDCYVARIVDVTEHELETVVLSEQTNAQQPSVGQLQVNNLMDTDESESEDMYVPSERSSQVQHSRAEIRLRQCEDGDVVVPFVLDTSIDYDNIKLTPKFTAEDLRKADHAPLR